MKTIRSGKKLIEQYELSMRWCAAVPGDDETWQGHLIVGGKTRAECKHRHRSQEKAYECAARFFKV